MTLLENLWYSNIDPHETILTTNKRYKHPLSLTGRNRDELSKTLTDKQIETLEKYDDAINEMHSVAEFEAFSYGFRLGIRLMPEAENNELLCQKTGCEFLHSQPVFKLKTLL